MHQSQKCLIIFTAGYHFPEEVRQAFAKIKRNPTLKQRTDFTNIHLEPRICFPFDLTPKIIKIEIFC